MGNKRNSWGVSQWANDGVASVSWHTSWCSTTRHLSRSALLLSNSCRVPQDSGIQCLQGRISTGPINGGHTGQSFQPDIPSQEPNLIVTRSYLSQLFTDRIEHLWTGFTNASPGLSQSLPIIKAGIFSPQGGVFLFYHGENYKLNMNGTVCMWDVPS